jgi:hypothetical protein
MARRFHNKSFPAGAGNKETGHWWQYLPDQRPVVPDKPQFRAIRTSFSELTLNQRNQAISEAETWLREHPINLNSFLPPMGEGVAELYESLGIRIFR